MTPGAYRTVEIPFDWNGGRLRQSRLALALLRAPIAKAAHGLDCKVRLVGGGVRDLLLMASHQAVEAVHLPADLDLVVEGDARKLGKRLQGEWGGSLLVHDSFLTATWHPDMQRFAPERPTSDAAGTTVSIDIVTARSEIYPNPGQLPRVTAGTFAQDMARRDISINTFALDLADWPGFREAPGVLKVHCHPDALRDLQSGRIRLLHAGSLQDDPTRIFRMARYEQRFGFALERETARWLVQAVNHNALATITQERIRFELEQVFDENKAVPVLQRLHEWSVLQALGLNPDPERLWLALERVMGHAEHNPEVLWVLLVGLQRDGAESLAPLPPAMTKAVREFQALVHRPWNGLRPSQVWQRLRFTRMPVRRALWACLPEQSVPLELYESQWRHVTPQVKGGDLIGLGYRSGPQIGQMLEQLHIKTLDGELQGRQQELDWAQRALGPPPEA